MTFKVDPAAIRAFSSQLGAIEQVAETAGRYVEANGNFTFHQQGIIGFALSGHRQLMADLRGMLTRLNELGVDSQAALRAVADNYRKTDAGAAAAVDVTYPEVARTPPGQD